MKKGQIMLIYSIIFGAFTLAILYMQYRLQSYNFRLALYDKRYAVFLSTMQYISSIIENAKASNEELMKFLRNSRDKEFLFASDIGIYLRELYLKGIELNKAILAMEREHDQNRLDNLVEKHDDLLKWFTNQIDVAKTQFEDYLAIRRK